MRILLFIVSISLMLGCDTNKDNNSFIVLNHDEIKGYLSNTNIRNFSNTNIKIYDPNVDTIGYLGKRLRNPKIISAYKPITKTRFYKYIMNKNNGAIYRLPTSYILDIGDEVGGDLDTLRYKLNDNLPVLLLNWDDYEQNDRIRDSVFRANRTPINNDAEWELIVKPIN